MVIMFCCIGKINHSNFFLGPSHVPTPKAPYSFVYIRVSGCMKVYEEYDRRFGMVQWRVSEGMIVSEEYDESMVGIYELLKFPLKLSVVLHHHSQLFSSDTLICSDTSTVFIQHSHPIFQVLSEGVGMMCFGGGLF